MSQGPQPPTPQEPEGVDGGGFPPLGATPGHVPPGAVPTGAYPPPGYYGPVPQGPGWGPHGYEAPRYPVEPAPYHHFWRAPGIQAWRLIFMLVLAPVAFLVVSLIGTIGVLVISALRGMDVMELMAELAEGRIGPDMLVANMVALALLVPACFLLSMLARQRPGYLSSVIGRFRWRWGLVCFGIALAAVLLAAVAMELFAPADMEGTALEVQPYSWVLFAILMVVTPLQAAGEEYLLRGIGFRALGSLLPWRTVGLVVSAVATSLVFMVIHGADDPWLNLVYFVMGLLFSYLTWRTGGIEAAVAMHVANNIIGMALVPFTDFSDLFDRSEGTGSAIMLIQLGMLLLAAVVMELLARRRKLAWSATPEQEPVPFPRPGRVSAQ